MASSSPPEARAARPTAVLFRLCDLSFARHAIPFFDLPAAYLEMPFFAYEDTPARRTTLFDAIPEPRVPEDAAERAFALYGEKHDLRGLRARHAIAATPEGMGVIAPAARFQPLPVDGDALREALESKVRRRGLVRETLDLAGRGFPASALLLGRHCWARGHDEEAYALLDAAYAGLHRPALREVLALHRKHRDLASVNVLAP